VVRWIERGGWREMEKVACIEVGGERWIERVGWREVDGELEGER
jgi:hypothetical protein